MTGDSSNSGIVTSPNITINGLVVHNSGGDIVVEHQILTIDVLATATPDATTPALSTVTWNVDTNANSGTPGATLGRVTGVTNQCSSRFPSR